jgi:hypothetical protein
MVAIHGRTVFPDTGVWVTSKVIYALQEDLYREAVEKMFRQVLISQACLVGLYVVLMIKLRSAVE